MIADDHDKSAARIDIERVLEIAADQFAEHGFEGVSMREIARECAYPLASIYYHFTSKSNLYTEAYSHRIEHTIDQMSSRLESVSDKHLRFETMILTFYDLFTGDRSLLLLMQRDVVDAAVTRRRFLSRRQYDYFNALIGRVAGEMLGTPVCREAVFAISSLIFGYCELSTMSHEVYHRDDKNSVQVERQYLVRAATALVDAG